MMTPTEQVRTVLESKGYIECNSCGEKDCGFYNHPTEASINAVDLTYSLDACHEVFEKDAPDSYWSWLFYVVNGDYIFTFDKAVKVLKSTCAQRIEAYLRDIGKWKD